MRGEPRRSSPFASWWGVIRAVRPRRTPMRTSDVRRVSDDPRVMSAMSAIRCRGARCDRSTSSTRSRAELHYHARWRSEHLPAAGSSAQLLCPTRAYLHSAAPRERHTAFAASRAVCNSRPRPSLNRGRSHAHPRPRRPAKAQEKPTGGHGEPPRPARPASYGKRATRAPATSPFRNPNVTRSVEARDRR